MKKEELPFEVNLPDGRVLNYNKFPYPSQEVLSDFPYIIVERLKSAPHLIVDNETTFKDIKSIILDPLTVISSEDCKAFYMRLQVNHEPGIKPSPLQDENFSITYPFCMDIAIKRVYTEKNLWALYTVEDEKEKQPFIQRILGSMHFKVVSNEDIDERSIQVEKSDQFPEGEEDSLAWVLHRLFKKGFFKINDDIGYGTYRKPSPDCGYYCISIAQKFIVDSN